MRALLQRVTKAEAAGEAIGKGMLILAAFEASDTQEVIEAMVRKLWSLRIFSDASGKMNLAAVDAGAQFLLVSQFTLYADFKGGNRPSFAKAGPKEKAKADFEAFVASFRSVAGNERVKNTAFGSDLQVALVNDGPVTLWLDSANLL